MDNQFACVINCMDGRVQEIVNEYMKNEYCVPFIDTITIAGPVKVLAENKKEVLVNDIKFRVGISINKHHSKIVAVTGHHDCLLVKVEDAVQIEFVKEAVKNVQKWFEDVTVIGLFVDKKWDINKIC